MKEIMRLQSVLSPEQLKAMEEVFLKTEMTLESFKLMRKDYTRVKNSVKRIEKKLILLIEQEGDDNFTWRWIEREVAHIENKYTAIEYAIKHYNVAMQSYNHMIALPRFLALNPGEIQSYTLNNLKSYLYAADRRIDEALNAIRITKRYFKNIASAFKSHAKLKAAKKEAQHRLWLNEMKAMKESEPEQNDGSPFQGAQ